jgi:hypothetical protein
LDRGAGRFVFDLIDGSERWGGAGAAGALKYCSSISVGAISD